jgi:hypothetical protein
MKIRAVGAEWFHADRRTDMMKLTVVFRDFANTPEVLLVKGKGKVPRLGPFTALQPMAYCTLDP